MGYNLSIKAVATIHTVHTLSILFCYTLFNFPYHNDKKNKRYKNGVDSVDSVDSEIQFATLQNKKKLNIISKYFFPILYNDLKTTRHPSPRHICVRLTPPCKNNKSFSTISKQTSSHTIPLVSLHNYTTGLSQI